MTFDTRGRLWVLTSPTYPHVLPGVPPNDKLIILEDTNRDGRADKLTVFADGLYIPTGFELGDGGVYVSQQPNLMFLRDTNGDGKADERRIILHGFGTEDSHHAIHAFTWGPGGALYFQEGTFLHSQVETPYGPVRLEDAGVFRYEPRTEKLSVFVSYRFANPWGHVVDRWGQNFISDASNGNNYYGTAFSGHVDYPRKQRPMQEWTLTQVRPTANVEFVSSRHFPDEAQGNFLVNNTIGFQGIKQYKVREEGSGFVGGRDRAAAAVDRSELPAGCDAVRPRRRALRRRLVQPAGRPHAVLAARSAARHRRTAASGASRRRAGRSTNGRGSTASRSRRSSSC